MAVTFPEDTDTSDGWPEWTWGEFNAWWSENLAPITPIPGHLTQQRDTTILEAWQHPAAASGIYVRFMDRVRRMVDHDAYFAARSAMDAYQQDQTPALLTEQLENSMAALVIPDAFLVAINGVSGGQQVTSVVGVENAGGTAAGAAAAVLAAYKVATGPLTQKPAQFALQNVRAMDLSSVNGDLAEVSDSSVGGLSSTFQLATNAACALVKWNGGTRSGSSRGRLYHGPIQENQINSDGRTLSPSYVTAIGTAYTAFRTSLAGAGYPLGVISRKNSTITQVTSQAVESIIATQRRRVR